MDRKRDKQWVVRQRGFSRRDILFGVLEKFRFPDTSMKRTGYDILSKQIDALIQEGQYETALIYLKKLIKKSPDHLQAQNKVGYCLLRLGRAKQAIHAFSKVLARDGKNNFALLYQGLAWAKEEDIPKAICCWQKYFNIDQPIIQRAINLQLALLEMGGPVEPAEIVNSIERAILEQARSDQKSG